MLDPASLDVAEEAATLAEALVYDAPGEAGDAHWNEEAKALIAGLLLCIIAEEPQERRTLSTLRDYLTITPAAFTALLTRMQGTTAAGQSPVPPTVISARRTGRRPAFSRRHRGTPISSIAPA